MTNSQSMRYQETYCTLRSLTQNNLCSSNSYTDVMMLHRDGLNVRAAQSDSAQVSIEMGQGYDLDNEIEGLRSDVGRLKQVSPAEKAIC